jgi:hypothetical protein
MNIYNTFQPLIYISRIFCLAPFAVVENSGAIKYKSSTFWLLYSILGVCVSFILQINVVWNKISIKGAILFNAAAEGITITVLLVSTTVQVISLYNGKNVIRILDEISLLDNEHDEARIRYYRLYKLFVIIIICNLISFVTPAVFSFAGINTNSMGIMLIIVYYGTVYFVGNFIIWLADLQFIHFVILLRYHFSLLNDSILNLTASPYRTTSDQTFESPGNGCDTSSGRSNWFPFHSVATIKSSIRRVCRQHSSLCDISELVNRTYSLHVLQFTALTLFEVVCGLYSFLIGVSHPGFSNYFSSYNYYVTYWVIWIFMLSAKVVLLAATCNYTSREVSNAMIF